MFERLLPNAFKSAIRGCLCFALKPLSPVQGEQDQQPERNGKGDDRDAGWPIQLKIEDRIGKLDNRTARQKSPVNVGGFRRRGLVVVQSR